MREELGVDSIYIAPIILALVILCFTLTAASVCAWIRVSAYRDNRKLRNIKKY